MGPEPEPARRLRIGLPEPLLPHRINPQTLAKLLETPAGVEQILTTLSHHTKLGSQAIASLQITESDHRISNAAQVTQALKTEAGLQSINDAMKGLPLDKSDALQLTYFDSLKREQETLSALVPQMDKLIGDLKQQMEKLDGSIQRLDHDDVDFDTDKAHLEDQIAQAKLKISQTIEDKTIYQSRLGSLTQAVTNMRAHIKELPRIRRLMAEKAQLEHELAQKFTPEDKELAAAESSLIDSFYQTRQVEELEKEARSNGSQLDPEWKNVRIQAEARVKTATATLVRLLPLVLQTTSAILQQVAAAAPAQMTSAQLNGAVTTLSNQLAMLEALLSTPASQNNSEIQTQVKALKAKIAALEQEQNNKQRASTITGSANSGSTRR